MKYFSPEYEFWGVWCVRDRRSVAGPSQAWLKVTGNVVRFTSRERAKAEAERLNQTRLSKRVHYEPRRLT